MPNQRAVRLQREALQTAIKLRLGWSEALRRKTEALLRLSRRPRTGLWIACYKNFFQQRAINE
jgi:hypothetical protein